MKPNVLLVIVDCLRYDYSLKMPFLRQLGQELPGGYWFENHWSTSHCTDPGIMNIITGKHPDELKLYSMMFDNKQYVAPKADTFFKDANENGYKTFFITNLQRWYGRDVKTFVDYRGKDIEVPWSAARQIAENVDGPWLTVLHTVDCHANYVGGSYKAACGFTDRHLKDLYDVRPKNTVFIVTSDHGEGLNEVGPDGIPVIQHGHGLWDFLTHIPLVVSAPRRIAKDFISIDGHLTSHNYTYRLVDGLISGLGMYWDDESLVFQAGATPRVFHRGVVDRFGRQFIRATHRDGGHVLYMVPENDPRARSLEVDLIEHCKEHGIDYGLSIEEEAMVVKRLVDLGYWKGKDD